MLDVLDRTMKTLADSHERRGHACRELPANTPTGAMKDTTCRVFYLGSLVKSLISNHYFPTPCPLFVHTSTSQVRRDLCTVFEKMQPMYTTIQRTNAQSTACSSLEATHSKCSPGIVLRKEIARMLPQTTLSSTQEAHLSQQAKKTGIFG